ncbi:MAG: phage tail-type lysozyme domain-containing protein [Candidatus Nomurabacteria bacterium]|jgi:hypothetical protein|nr:phage tail-type lysozyme domain-containing protein [Candidatus Nomurabacteria bacterium]
MTWWTERFRVWAKVILFTLLSLVVSIPVSALSGSRLDMFAENNILFYDPEGDLDDCSTVNFATKPGGDQITWIGDSYSVGARTKIETKFLGVDLGTSSSTPNIMSNKSFAYDIDGTTRLATHGNIGVSNPSGLTILNQLKDSGSLRRYVVFPLGSNDQGTATDTMMGFINELQSIVGSDHTVILMTPRTHSYTYDSIVDAVKQSAQKYPNILIADWEKAVEGNLDEYFSSSDPIHPNDRGYDLFVETIYNALPGGSVSTVAGNNNAEKAWNYFVNANIPGVSDNPAAIAGIIGNFQAESTTDINPFLVNGSYRGIFQTSDSAMLQAMTDAGISHEQYWTTQYAMNAPQDVNDAALQVQLDYLVEKYNGFSAGSSMPGFVKYLDRVTNSGGEDGAASYAELFLVTVERAVNGSEMLQDSQVQNFVNTVLYASNPQYQNKPYQGTVHRRNYAKSIYRQLAGVSATVVSGAAASSGIAQWEDGWLSDNSIPGITKEDANNTPLSETPKAIGSYRTPDGKPNKILLHNTEGTQNGLAAYPANNKFPAHFTIDLTRKQGYQHFSIWQPSLAIVGDEDGPIQIEIVGFSTRPGRDYDLYGFSADDWDYLAVLLIAIAEQTGIPLTTSVDWENPGKVSDFLNYVGVIGHMHVPRNDHSDPGNIWPMVSQAIARNPNGAKFASGGSGAVNCGVSSYTGLVAGGMTKAEADAFMQIYKDIRPREWGTGGILGTEWDIAATSTCVSDLENCVAFSQYFINRYTAKHITGLPNGSDVVSRVVSSHGFIDGGTTPKPYAIFSVASGSTMCGSKPCGHTGVVLGIDTANNKIIVGEAGCGQSLDWTGAHEYDLSKYTSGAYSYAYTDDILKGL